MGVLTKRGQRDILTGRMPCENEGRDQGEGAEAEEGGPGLEVHASAETCAPAGWNKNSDLRLVLGGFESHEYYSENARVWNKNTQGKCCQLVG